jgi:hypothetical protein
MADKPVAPKIGLFEWVIIGLFVFVGFSMFAPVLTGDVLDEGIFNALIYVLYKIFFAVLPFVALVLLGYIAFKMWKHYINQDFISGIDFVLLEIIPPRDVLRSPKAMELFLTNALYHYSRKGGMEEFWQGAVWFWFSLEIVSNAYPRARPYRNPDVCSVSSGSDKSCGRLHFGRGWNF